MDDALHRVHTFKDVFIPGQSRKTAKVKVNAPKTELLKKWKVDEKTNAETWTPSKNQREMNVWRDHISHEMDDSKVLGADFNFPMIHLMSHWVEQIPWYGALQQYCAKRHEQAHETNLNDVLNASNHNLNYLPQLITLQRRILCLKIRELNLQALAQLWEYNAAACKVLASGPDQAAPLRSQSYAKPKFMGPQNHCDGKHPDAMNKDFRALLDDTQDGTHRMGTIQQHAGVSQPEQL